MKFTPLPHLTFTLRAKRILLTSALALLPAIGWSQDYTVTNLGTLGGSTSTPYAVNNLGQVVGSANIAGDSHADPFLYSNGAMTDVWTGGTKFGATTIAINDSGHIVVNYNLDAKGDTESFWYDGVIWADLGTGGAVAMNANDMVVGDSNSDPYAYWIWNNGVLNTAPGYSLSGAAWGYPLSVNNSGVITGFCQPPNREDYGYGCVFGPNVSYALEATDGDGAPMTIRSDGTTCGIDFNGNFTEWDTMGNETVAVQFGSDSAICQGLNDYGVGVGNYYSSTNDILAVIYDPLNGLRDLNGLYAHNRPRPDEVRLDAVLNAVAISNTGYIAASCQYTGLRRSVTTNACLLTPIPAQMMKDNIEQLAKKNHDCEICSRDLVPEAKSLPKSLEGLSSREKKEVQETIEKIQENLRKALEDEQISAPQEGLLLEDSEMVLKAIGVGLP